MAAHQALLSLDSTGKNAGAGCHFLLQCMKVKSESEVAQLYPALLNPMDCSLPGSSIHGIFQERVLEWVAIAFSNTVLITYYFFLKHVFLKPYPLRLTQSVYHIIHLLLQYCIDAINYQHPSNSTGVGLEECL